MDSSRKTILVAFAVGALLVGTALYFKLQIPVAETDNSLAVVVTTDVPRARIEIKDSDGDGVPDWQESLHRADPVVIEEVDDTYEPETLTDVFSIRFFQDMMISRNLGAAGADPLEVAERAAAQMGDIAVDDLYGAADITLTPDNSNEAVKRYSNQMATIVIRNTVPADALNEAEILKQAYTLNDQAMLEQLNPILAMYKDMVDSSLATPVPSSYSKEHLDIINVYNAIYNDILAMKEGFDDPVTTVVRLKRYEEDVTALYVVMLNLQKKALTEGVTLTESDPAYRFIVQ